MSSFIAIIVIMLLCLVYARLRRDHRVYTKLMFGVILGFIVGIVVKQNCLTTNTVNETVSSPTLQSHPSAVVGTEDSTNSDMLKVDEIVMGQDTLESDTFSKTVYNYSNEPLITPEIQDDS